MNRIICRMDKCRHNKMNHCFRKVIIIDKLKQCLDCVIDESDSDIKQVISTIGED